MNQEEYLEILFNDCGFSPSQRRNFLSTRFSGRRYFDELSTTEKSALIVELKTRRSCAPTATDDEVDEWEELTAKERARKRGNNCG